MAAVVNAEMVRAAASARSYALGEALHASDCVSGLEDADGGAVALVAPDDAQDAGAGEREAWVGVEGGTLAGECDCLAGGAEPDGLLCAHAVAVALAALEAGMRWAPAAHSHTEGATDPAAAFDALDAAEKARVLDALLLEHPELLTRAQQLAVLPGHDA